MSSSSDAEGSEAKEPTGTIFGDVFDIRSPKVRARLLGGDAGHALEELANAPGAKKLVENMRDKMKTDHHISINGELAFDAGSIGLISKIASTVNNKIIDDAVARIDNVDTLINPIVLHPVVHHTYEGPLGDNYHLYVMPHAPDFFNPDTGLTNEQAVTLMVDATKVAKGIDESAAREVVSQHTSGDITLEAAAKYIQDLGATLEIRKKIISMLDEHGFGKALEMGTITESLFNLRVDSAIGEKISNADVRRTIRVLKATGKEHCFWDYRTDNDNFVFLKGTDGEILRYPIIERDPDFKGHLDKNGKMVGEPIAYFRDYNGLSKSPDKTKGTNRADKSGILGTPLNELWPAPVKCLEACSQQYERSTRLIDNLKAAHIKPNVLPPMGKWSTRTSSTSGPSLGV